MPINFVMQGKCLFSDISRPERYKMKSYENVIFDINVRIKIKKPRLFHVWLFGVDFTMCKLNKRSIIFVMQSNIVSKHAAWMAKYTMVVNKR